jgi:hypothetical protein
MNDANWEAIMAFERIIYSLYTNGEMSKEVFEITCAIIKVVKDCLEK